MRNVYDNIEKFYQSLDDRYSIIPKSLIEGYLRKEAWQGVSDKDLKRLWNMIGWLLNYFINTDVEDINEMTAKEYAKALIWMSDQNPTFLLSQKSLEHCLEVLESFFQHLAVKGFVAKKHFSADEIKALFFQHGKFQRPIFVSSQPEIFHAGFSEQDLASPFVQEQLNCIIDSLLNKIGAYFKREEYLSDLNRAVFLYSGPLPSAIEDEERYWLGFWDYFLFDYHLIFNDKHPLQHFYEQCDKELSPDESHIIEDLLKAKFTVFSISRILNDAMICCTDLLTGQEFNLPMPDFGFYDYKNTLLYGHVYPQGVLMLNYISSVSVSQKFQKRIRDEIIRQHEIFKVQDQAASLDDFYDRNAVLVRHTIHIFTTLAKVNITSDQYLAFTAPTREPQIRLPEKAEHCLDKLVKRYKMSIYSQKLLRLMLIDFLHITIPSDEDMDYLVGAAVIIFSELNGGFLIKRAAVLRCLNLSRDRYEEFAAQMYKALELRKFDPRYMNEEGFVYALYE